MKEDITELLRRNPFGPFIIHLRDGQLLSVETVERLSTGKNASYYVNAEGYLVIVPHHAIETITVREPTEV